GQDSGGTGWGTAPAPTSGQTRPARRTHRQRAGEVPHRRQTPHRHHATTVHRGPRRARAARHHGRVHPVTRSAPGTPRIARDRTTRPPDRPNRRNPLMSNIEHPPTDQPVCTADTVIATEPDIELLHPREVPLGGQRAMLS